MLMPNQSFRTEVKKMGPDQADVHVMGGGGCSCGKKKHRAKLKKIQKG